MSGASSIIGVDRKWELEDRAHLTALLDVTALLNYLDVNSLCSNSISQIKGTAMTLPLLVYSVQ